MLISFPQNMCFIKKKAIFNAKICGKENKNNIIKKYLTND